MVIFKSLFAGTVGDVIFVTDSYHNEVYFSQLSESILVPLSFSNIESPTGIAFDPFEDRVYWCFCMELLVRTNPYLKIKKA